MNICLIFPSFRNVHIPSAWHIAHLSTLCSPFIPQMEVGLSLISLLSIRVFRVFSKVWRFHALTQHLKNPPFLWHFFANFDFSYMRYYLEHPSLEPMLWVGLMVKQTVASVPHLLTRLVCPRSFLEFHSALLEKWTFKTITLGMQNNG